MEFERRKRARLGSVALGLIVASGCGDDTVSASRTAGTDIGDSDSDESGETADGETGDTGDTGDTGETGDPVEGASMGAWVNAGANAATSLSYQLRFAFGQSSTNQNTMTSRSYRLQGGLVPATE